MCKPPMRFLLPGAALLACAALALAHIDETVMLPLDHPAIQYEQGAVDDPVAVLGQKLDSGAARLEFTPGGLGYLPSLLKLLGINVDSQALVFSKTSFQAPKISPQNPRAIYFNDTAAVGFVPGGEVYEVLGLDSHQGIVFYTLDTHQTEHPGFARRDVCLQCHLGPGTLGVPGLMVTSVYPGANGMPAPHTLPVVTDDRTPLDESWGGWYVTGTHGSQYHRGNAVAPDPQQPELLELRGTQNVTSLAKKFDTGNYLAPTSDIVALLTLEHQTRMANLLTRVGWETRIAGHEGKLDDAARKRIDSAVDDLVTYMVFADEAPLREPVRGVSTFTETFPRRGPRDHEGRSLRDFDLQTRLFRYPLSYMIYSPAFDGLPDFARERIYRRLYDVLSGKDTDAKFARLSAEDCRAALEILRDTKPNLPAYFRASARVQ